MLINILTKKNSKAFYFCFGLEKKSRETLSQVDYHTCVQNLVIFKLFNELIIIQLFSSRSTGYRNFLRKGRSFPDIYVYDAFERNTRKLHYANKLYKNG